ncbi:MAG: DUF3971 domain-containing protein [Hyphomonadaceae bacterium]|nr:DUF3971 domain-containing protein [Hyphomonadaceae bacterium]
MRISPKLLIIEIFAFLVFAILAAAGFLAWRLSQGPIDLEMIRPQVERSLTDARGGQPVKIENLVLEWVRDRGRVEAVARGFTAMDKANNVAFRAERAMIALDAGSLVGWKFKTRQLRLENGTASVVRSKEGVWTLADMVLAREPDASDKPFDPIRDLNWTTLATPVRALISAGDFEQVELANFRLDIDDQKAGTKWSANPVAGSWSAKKEGVAINLDATLADALVGEPNAIRINIVSDGDVTRAAGKLTLQGVDPMSIARMFGYTGDGFSSGKPASATFSIAATEKGGLQSTKLSLAGVTGSGHFVDQTINVRDLSFDAAYDPATKQITLENLKIDSDRLAGEFTGSMDATAIMSGDTTSPTPFKLSGTGFTLGFTPVFEAPWEFTSAEVEASISPDARRMTITSLKAVTGGLNAAASGELWLEGQGDAQQLGVKVSAVGTGDITPQQVVAFWPVDLGASARLWVRDRIPAGKTTKAVFNVDWPPGANSKGFLPDENLALEFTVENASVIFLDDFPPVTGISGVGHLKGNSLVVDVSAGMLDKWQVDEGRVVLPRFSPGGAMMDVKVSGRGGLPDMMRVLDRSNLQVGSRYGLMIDQMTGTGSVDVHVQHPMRDDVRPEEELFSVTGGFVSASAPDLVGDFDLANANVNFQLDQNGMTMSGSGDFGPAPVSFQWRERTEIGASEAETVLTAKARATPDLLNAFGLAARNFMQGEAAVELTASGPGGRNFTAITAKVDLTHSQLDIEEFGWSKKYDAPAEGTFRYGKGNEGAILTGDIRADGLELIGEGRMDNAGVFQTIDIERLFSRDRVDLRGMVNRKQDGGYRVWLNGPFFDASPWMDSMLNMSSGAGAQTEDSVGGPVDPGPVFDLQLNADRLRVRENAEIGNAKVAFAIDGEGPRTGTITGLIARGKNLNVAINTVDGVRNISARMDDAGFGARVLLNADYLIGGKLTFDGKFKGADGQALVTMTDVRLKDAPLVAQLFSLASLQGLADVLSGDGVMFSEVNAPVRFVGGRIDLPGMRATGPAMGLTARGWIAPESSELALDGVLAPSFVGANSVLGVLPIIGDLFVSRQGEGMFAPTYSVRGTFARARITINPIAVLTPGVLRQIFENPAVPPPVATEPSVSQGGNR